jgi:hypothetical protein
MVTVMFYDYYIDELTLIECVNVSLDVRGSVSWANLHLLDAGLGLSCLLFSGSAGQPFGFFSERIRYDQ